MAVYQKKKSRPLGMGTEIVFHCYIHFLSQELFPQTHSFTLYLCGLHFRFWLAGGRCKVLDPIWKRFRKCGSVLYGGSAPNVMDTKLLRQDIVLNIVVW